MYGNAEDAFAYFLFHLDFFSCFSFPVQCHLDFASVQ